MARKEPEGLRRKSHSHGHRQRMRQRIIEHGTANLADYELLEMLLFYVIPRRDTKPLAKELLQKFGSLTALSQASDTMLHDAGLTQRVAAVLKIPYLAARALAEEHTELSQIQLKNMTMLKRYFGSRLHEPIEEETSLLYLDGRNNLLKEERLTRHQKISASHRLIATQLLDVQATAFIVVHIAPSHSAAVLAQEARGLAMALKPLSITMHDVILFGAGWVSSLNKERLL